MNNNGKKRVLRVGGTIYADRHIYITRQDLEDEVYKTLKDGNYCNILSSRQVGKSSIMTNVALRLKVEGTHIVTIDVAGDLGTPETPDQWYRGLLGKVISALKLTCNINAWWEKTDEATANLKLLRFFRDEISSKINAPVVIFLDEIDHTLGLDYTDDFFTAIRSMFNQRGLEEAYNKVTFCLVGVASPNELIKERRTTAYNVGKTVAIRDFKLERDDLSPLLKLLSRDRHIGQHLLESIFEWTDGHPYLTSWLSKEIIESGIKSRIEVDLRAKNLFASLDRVSSDVHFQQITRFLGNRVSDQIGALALYERLLRNSSLEDKTTHSHIELKLSGIVKRGDAGDLVIRNRIYRRVFNLEWVQNELVGIDRPFAKDLTRWLELNRCGSALLKGPILERAYQWAKSTDNVSELEWEFLEYSRKRELEDTERDVKRLLLEKQREQEKRKRIEAEKQREEEERKRIQAERMAERANRKRIDAEREKEEQEHRKRRFLVYWAITVGFFASAVVAALHINRQKLRFDSARKVALESAATAELAQKKAESARQEAEEQAERARQAEKDAKIQRSIADSRAKEAERARRNAEQKRREAEKLKIAAEKSRESAKMAQEKAEKLAALEKSARESAEKEKQKKIKALESAQNLAQEAEKARKRAEREKNNTEKLQKAYRLTSVALTEAENDATRAIRLAEQAKSLESSSIINDSIYKIYQENEFYSTKFKHESAVISVAFMNNEPEIHTISETGKKRVWDLTGQLKETSKFYGSREPGPYKVQSLNGELILVGNKDGTAKLFDRYENPLKTFKGHQGAIRSVAFSPDGKSFLTGSDDGTARLWIITGSLVATLKGHSGKIESLDIDTRGKYLISSSADGTVKLWNLGNYSLVHTFEIGPKIRALAFHPNGKYFILAPYKSDPQLMDLQGKIITSFTGHMFSVRSFAFSADGETVLTGSDDGTARLWDLNGEILRIFKGHEASIYSVAFSPDGKKALTGARDKTARIWNLQGNQEPVAIHGHQDTISSVSFSSDGNYMVTSSFDMTARLWNVDAIPSNIELKHSSPLRVVTLSPNGHFILTGCDDAKIRLWNKEGQLLRVYRGHKRAVRALKFAPDGETFASGADDQTIRIWKTSPDLDEFLKEGPLAKLTNEK